MRAVNGWFLVLAMTTGCGGQRTAAQVEKPVSNFDIPHSPEADDIGKFLGGVPGRSDGPFAAMEKDNAWFWHRKAFDNLYDRFEADRLPVLQGFRNKQFEGPHFANETVFYPFGGPDVLYATTFFPKAKTYILVGLEPPGTLPEVKAVQEMSMEKYLPKMAISLESLLRKSFFVTASMDAQFRGQVTDGLLPVMLVQLARMKAKILGFQAITLNEKGEIVNRKLAKLPPSSLRNDGMAMEFQMEGDTQVKRLLYFSANLSDEPLSNNASFRMFVGNLKPVTTFFKSASYLPHRKNFSQMRELVMANSRAIVQDDTGIPFRFVDQSQWDARLYGKYTHPYGSFKNMVQPDLRKAFETNSVNPLGFYIGYGYGRAPSALLVFAKKT